ncbi:hypothetical protein MLD38_006199 [Melastoma candidum]|uniref:Uncharacterized protein n=1 Tax=Melastoma candidum TaxID=119954 RepID=A0ACB9RLU8_9MYRT|nr:hypothetical protein MLD38_006199 [Melastoma candidum]
MSTSFNRKCTLLTHYFKEKGCFSDLSLGLTIPTSTPPGGVGSVVLPRTATQVKSMDLFPQGVGFGSGEVTDNTSGSPRKAKTAPMTIFYAGQVLVFDDFPADKAKERDSLLRFLEKRKDRITTRASPYPQVKGRRRSKGESTGSGCPTPDPEEKSSWLSLWGQMD